MDFQHRWVAEEHGHSATWTVYAVTPAGRDVVAVGFTREDAQFVCDAHAFIARMVKDHAPN